MPDSVMSHLTLCVRDLDASTRFYIEAFGFEVTYGRSAGDEFAPLMGMAGFDVELVMMRKNGFRMELVGYRAPAPHARPDTPTNTLGFTHIAFNVPDVDEALRRIETHGGTVLADRRVSVTLGGEKRDYAFATDLDGTRIEVIKGAILG